MVNSYLKNVVCSKNAKNFLVLLFVLACGPSFAQQKRGKAPAVDTFKLADKLIAEKKFRKASKLYTAYSAHHPKDFNATWKLAQTQFWLHHFHKADSLYSKALRMAPKNDYLRLNYIHSLMDMGKTSKADKMLTDMELGGSDYSEMSSLRARLAYYEGDYREAAAYMRKSLNAESNNPEGHELEDQIALARAPMVALSSSYLSDNQPITAFISTIKAENYFSRYADLYLTADEYHFTEGKVSDAPWVRVGDKLFFPKAGIHLNLGAGVFGSPVKHEAGWSGNVSANFKLSSQFDIDVSADHVPYLDTKISIDTDITVTRLSAMLNWHLRNWSAHAAVLNSTFPDNTNVTGTYGWVLAPIVGASHVQLLAGASAGFATSSSNSYKPIETGPEALAHFSTNPTPMGAYDPFFTPNEQFTATGLVQLNLYPSKVVSVNLGGGVGYGSINAPYLYLNKDTTISKGYSWQTFTPAEVHAAVNFHIARSWLLWGKYTYTNTYFFSSNYVTVGIQKSFIPHKHRNESGSTYSRLMDEIESELQALYHSSNEEDLRSGVGDVRSKLVKLRDAQRERQQMSETLKGSDEANALQDRYDALNEMIEELDAVDLNDFQESGKSKKQWLVDKLFELTSITYNGSRE